MAYLYITEYSSPNPKDRDGDVMLALEPAIAEQKVEFTTSTQSAAFNAATSVIRIIADADCHLEFGANPTATANNQLLPANVIEWRQVVPGQEVAAYDGTS